MANFLHVTLALTTLTAAVASSSLVGAAATWTDDGHAINAVGSGKFFVGDCMGKNVRLVGDRQQIMLVGTCKTITARGSGSRLTLDGSTSLRLVGNDNVVTWKARPSSVTVVGRNNTLSDH